MDNTSLFEVGCVGDSEFVTTGVALDSVHDLLWCSHEDGRIVSWLLPSMERYSATRSAEAVATAAGAAPAVVAIVPDAYGVSAVSPGRLRYHSKGAVPIHGVDLGDIEACCAVATQRAAQAKRSRIACGGARGVAEVDVLAGAVLATARAPVISGVVALNAAARAGSPAVVHCGTSDGAVVTLDTRTMQASAPAARIEAHPAGVADIDSRADLLVTCGFAKRMGVVGVDPYLKVFDTRTNRLLRSVLVTPGPNFVRFHPKLTSTLIAVSPSGVARLVEAATGAVSSETTGPLECDSEATCFDVSASGDALFIGDSAGHVHVWADRPDFHANLFPAPLVLPEVPPLPLTAPILVQDEAGFVPFSAVPFPEDGDDQPLASTWDSTSFPISAPQRPFDPTLLPALQKFERGSWLSVPRLSNAQLKALAHSQPRLAKRIAAIRKGVVSERPEKPYRHLDLKTKSKIKGEIDFARHNRTPFTGLENGLPNSYVNAMIQPLYFMPHVRSHVLNHLCSRDACLACELSFLFKMLDQSRSCFSAGNFLRAFRQIPQALALGILESTSRPASAGAGSDLTAMITNFCRFALEQIHKELSTNASSLKAASVSGAPPVTTSGLDPIIDSLFGVSSKVDLKCTNCTAEWQRSSKSFVIDLAPTKGLTSFCDTVEASLGRTLQTKAWCDRCAHFQQTEQRRAPTKLPTTLCFCVSSANDRAEGAWPFLAASCTEEPAATAAATTAAAATRDTADANFRSPWMPLRMRLTLDAATAKLTAREEPPATPAAPEVYELTTLLCHVLDPDPKAPTSGNLVAHVRVPAEYWAARRQDAPSSPPSGQWVLFNDFRVNQTSAREVVRFPPWKRPCVIVYTRSTVAAEHQLPALVSPIDSSPFLSRQLLNSHVPGVTPIIVPQSMLPKRGDLVAIDAEYVSLTAEEIVTELDGTRVVVTPSHLSVARVSCVFGQGPLLGEPIIDDHVFTPEPVIDYLTRFSGVVPGDLDPAVSRKRLTTLKNVYLKLRWLIDSGCIFVGHGLHNDLKVLGIHVPPEQVIDTVELFHIERQRWVSLRFLAAFLLHIDIQANVHDSVEDARTALALYNVFQELHKSGQVQKVIQDIYQAGRTSNWQPHATAP